MSKLPLFLWNEHGCITGDGLVKGLSQRCKPTCIIHDTGWDFCTTDIPCLLAMLKLTAQISPPPFKICTAAATEVSASACD